MIVTVSVRIIADTEADAAAAITALGDTRVAWSSPRAGRMNEWLVYGTLQFERAEQGTLTCEACGRETTARANGVGICCWGKER